MPRARSPRTAPCGWFHPGGHLSEDRRRGIPAGACPPGGTGGPDASSIRTVGHACPDPRILAATDPSGASPVFPGLTNYQAALLTGEATFILFCPTADAVLPLHRRHLRGRARAERPAGPDRPPYSPESSWIPAPARRPSSRRASCGRRAGDLRSAGRPLRRPPRRHHEPDPDVGAGGGFGEYGIYTTTLLGSTDVTTHIVDLTPPDQRLSDYGHADLFFGDDARLLSGSRSSPGFQAH